MGGLGWSSHTVTVLRVIFAIKKRENEVQSILQSLENLSTLYSMYSQLAVVRLPSLLSSFSNFLFLDFLAVDRPKTQHNPLFRNATIRLDSTAQVKSMGLFDDLPQYINSFSI